MQNEKEATEESLLQLVAAQLWKDEDVELSCGNQMLTVLKDLADPLLPARPPMLVRYVYHSVCANYKFNFQQRVDRRRTEFLALLYNTVMEGLCAPLIVNTANDKLFRGAPFYLL